MAQMTEYQKDLIEALKDPQEAAAYLNAALEEGDKESFLLALRNIAEAKRRHEGRGRKSAPEQGKSLSHLVSPRESRNPHLVQSVAWCRSAS